MNAKQLILVLISTMFVAACGVPETPAAVTSGPATALPVSTATPEPADPLTIVHNFQKGLEDGDLEAAMALLADDIKFRGVPYLSGKDAVRRYLQAIIDDEGWRQEISDLKVEGNTVTYNWTVYNPNGAFSARGVEVIHIQDGKIVLIESESQ
jgi:ketosteroid isomerase-like protein